MNKDVQDEFVSILYDAVMDGKVKAYDRCLNQYAPADIQRYFDDCDTVVLTREGKKEFIMCRKPSMEDIHQLTFLEDWKIDTTDFHLEKFIHGICFYISRYDTANVFLDQYPLFWIFYDRSMPMEIQAYKDCY